MGRYRTGSIVVLALCAACLGCQRAGQDALPPAPTITHTDKFFDVQALDGEHAIVVGYGGKILLTADGGRTWARLPSGTRRALYRVRFVDRLHGWIAGQDGVILHSADGGLTWARQQSGTDVSLFSLSFADRQHGWAVGDKSIFLETHDGGANWRLHKIIPASQREIPREEAVVSEDPVLYDVHFLDARTGWVTGEFGKIYHTADGGQSWSEQEHSLLGGEIADPLDLPTFFGIHMLDARHGTVAGLDGRIADTEDGVSWKFHKMELDYPLADPLFTPVRFADGTGWAVGAAGELVRLDAPEGAWRRARLGMEVFTWMRGMSWLNPHEGWIVGGLGLILHTRDGGQTWLPARS